MQRDFGCIFTPLGGFDYRKDRLNDNWRGGWFLLGLCSSDRFDTLQQSPVDSDHSEQHDPDNRADELRRDQQYSGDEQHRPLPHREGGE